MNPSIEKLYKILSLEAQNGFNDRAVIGGLANMLNSWENEARLEGVPEPLIRSVNSRLRDYRKLTVVSREETLQGLWRRVRKTFGEDLPILGAGERQTSPSPPRVPPPPGGAPAPVHNEAPVPVPQEAPVPVPLAEEPAPRPAPNPGLSERVAPVAVVSPPAESGQPAALNAPLTVIPGVGKRYAQTLEKLGIRTLGDALYYFPRRYDDYSRLKPIHQLWYGEEVTVIGTVDQVSSRPIRGGKTKIIEAVVSDGTGALRVTWFNQPWLVKKLRDTTVVLSGKVDQYLGRLVMTSPEWEPVEKKNLHTNRIVPVYPLTATITQRWLRRTLNQVVSYWAPRVKDYLPEELIRSAGLLSLPSALFQIHFPHTWDKLEQARYRLAFDEIFLLQLGVLRQRRGWKSQTARVFTPSLDWQAERFANLPYALTQAQKRVVDDLRTDLASGHPMNRLLQGDVGSGKTVVAAMGIAMVIQGGAQAAMMAPTSILAEQHYHSLLDLLSGENGVLRADEIRLMIGATPESEKQAIREGLRQGEVKLVVGTHALIEDPVVFQDLQLVIIDEQHRFGVHQRAALRKKGTNPHLLVMTATPIPRSLALTVYGDLDLSVLDEMPPGRQEVGTYVLYPLERERAYNLIRKQVELGHQAFIIYPLVEETEKSEAKAAVEEWARLQEQVFPHLQLGLLHGRLKPDEKEAVMAQFRDGEVQILVSTTVVEVGVDVSNATVMLVEGANRFGLAQLHQLRGRVGRGQAQSYCLLIPDTEDAVENERLEAMVETSDGFVLAEKDLQYRGPGEFLGTRQSGFSELKMASITDVPLIEKARRYAQELFTQDPELSSENHQPLAKALARFWRDGASDIS